MSQKNNPYCLKFTLVLSCMLLCLFSRGQYNFQELDNLLSANQKVMGNDLVTLIYKDGKIVYQKEMGDFKIKSRASIAGCSKWLTAALIMTFVDEGKISLDDKVSSFLPIFETYGKSYITIRQCLSHQTGIAAPKILERRKYESLEEEVNSFAKREIAANPGTTFFYSNMGLNIAGRVLEVISKKRFDLLIKQRIFTPLNMKSSSFTPEDNGVDPSGGAVSTAGDYMNFLTMISGKGMFMGKRILTEAAITQMQTVQTGNITKKYTPKGTEGYEYGLGEWIEATDKTGNDTVVSSPALYGTWPYIDKCRNYACVFFIKSLPGEPKKNFYMELKKLIDNQIPSGCK
ncbi:MAG: beta-lactamase family protein [Ferruginibacter sp.]|nr:beta-lactamase family protein [Ferruginibacter sp.]